MKNYVKPTIEFIELKPDERFACHTSSKTGCCGYTSTSSNFFWKWWGKYWG